MEQLLFFFVWIVWKLKHFVSSEVHKVALWGGNNIWVNFKSVTLVKQQFRKKTIVYVLGG